MSLWGDLVAPYKVGSSAVCVSSDSASVWSVAIERCLTVCIWPLWL